MVSQHVSHAVGRASKTMDRNLTSPVLLVYSLWNELSQLEPAKAAFVWVKAGDANSFYPLYQVYETQTCHSVEDSFSTLGVDESN